MYKPYFARFFERKQKGKATYIAKVLTTTVTAVAIMAGSFVIVPQDQSPFSALGIVASAEAEEDEGNRTMEELRDAVEDAEDDVDAARGAINNILYDWDNLTGNETFEELEASLEAVQEQIDAIEDAVNDAIAATEAAQDAVTAAVDAANAATEYAEEWAEKAEILAEEAQELEDEYKYLLQAAVNAEDADEAAITLAEIENELIDLVENVDNAVDEHEAALIAAEEARALNAAAQAAADAARAEADAAAEYAEAAEEYLGQRVYELNVAIEAQEDLEMELVVLEAERDGLIEQLEAIVDETEQRLIDAENRVAAALAALAEAERILEERGAELADDRNAAIDALQDEDLRYAVRARDAAIEAAREAFGYAASARNDAIALHAAAELIIDQAQDIFNATNALIKDANALMAKIDASVDDVIDAARSAWENENSVNTPPTSGGSDVDRVEYEEDNDRSESGNNNPGQQINGNNNTWRLAPGVQVTTRDHQVSITIAANAPAGTVEIIRGDAGGGTYTLFTFTISGEEGRVFTKELGSIQDFAQFFANWIPADLGTENPPPNLGIRIPGFDPVEFELDEDGLNDPMDIALRLLDLSERIELEGDDNDNDDNDNDNDGRRRPFRPRPPVINGNDGNDDGNDNEYTPEPMVELEVASEPEAEIEELEEEFEYFDFEDEQIPLGEGYFAVELEDDGWYEIFEGETPLGFVQLEEDEVIEDVLEYFDFEDEQIPLELVQLEEDEAIEEILEYFDFEDERIPLGLLVPVESDFRAVSDAARVNPQTGEETPPASNNGTLPLSVLLAALATGAAAVTFKRRQETK